MLRYCATQAKTQGISFIDKQISKTDQVGPISVKMARSLTGQLQRQISPYAKL